MITVVEDYIGKYHIAKDEYTEENLDQYIKDNEKKYMRCLLGDSLYVEWIGDLLPTSIDVPQLPQQQRFLDLLNGGITYQDSYKKTVLYEGVRSMLLGFVYSEFLPDNWSRHTVTGNAKSNRDVSELTTPNQTVIQAEKRFNDSVNYYQAAQQYIKRNTSTFPEYQNNTVTIKRRFTFAGI